MWKLLRLCVINYIFSGTSHQFVIFSPHLLTLQSRKIHYDCAVNFASKNVLLNFNYICIRSNSYCMEFRLWFWNHSLSLTLSPAANANTIVNSLMSSFYCRPCIVMSSIQSMLFASSFCTAVVVLLLWVCVSASFTTFFNRVSSLMQSHRSNCYLNSCYYYLVSCE